MFRLRSAFFKLVAVFAVLSGGTFSGFGTFLGGISSSWAEDSLPRRALVIQTPAGGAIKVGDRLSYAIEGGEKDWSVSDPRPPSESGYLFLEGNVFVPLIAAEFWIPALRIVDGAGSQIAETEPLTITAQSNLEGLSQEEASKPADAIAPMSLPFPLTLKAFLSFLGAMTAVVLAYFILRFIKRRAQAALNRRKPKKPYDLAALDRLEEVHRDASLKAKGHQPLYFLVSEVMKAYLSERFEIDARESTSEELFVHLRGIAGVDGLDEKMVSRIESLFREMDWVKFADRKAEDSEASRTVQEAKEIVQFTRRRTPDPILTPEKTKEGTR